MKKCKKNLTTFAITILSVCCNSITFANLQKNSAEYKKAILKNSRLKIAIIGSSVANGGGTKDGNGWANMLGKILKQRNWEYVNKSINGNNTRDVLSRLDTDLFPEKPDVAIIGLSLGNEGIRNGPGAYFMFRRNIKKIIQLLRKHGIVPMVTNCYPHKKYNAVNYAYVKKFNEELDRWPVISFDFMGSIDDGTGKWIEGYSTDDAHPNNKGHKEMLLSIPPRVFDNYMEGCLSSINPVNTWFNFEAKQKNKPAMKFVPRYFMGSFSFAFDVKFSQIPSPNSIIAAVNENKIKVSPNNTLIYVSDKNVQIDSNIKIETNKLYHIALTHRKALKKTTLYVNDNSVSTNGGKIKPKIFTLGGGVDGNGCKSQFRNITVYRSSKRADQIKRLFNGIIGYSSLTIFSPLNDGVIEAGLEANNLAPDECRFVFLQN